MRKQLISWVADYGGRIQAFRGELYLGYAYPARTPGHYIVQPCGERALVAADLKAALCILEINRS